MGMPIGIINMLAKTESEREDRMAEQVLDMLDRWSERLAGHQSQKREFPRKRYRAKITLYIPESAALAGECAEASTLEVISRNISQSGLSFIYRGLIKADKIVVCLDPHQGGTHWYQGMILRRRQVHNEFWEYGVKFTGTAQI